MTRAAALLLMPVMLSAQDIYRSPQFTVSSDRVTQSQFIAHAHLSRRDRIELP